MKPGAAKRALAAFEAHHERYLFRGCGNPDYAGYYEEQYERARKRMLKHLEKAGNVP
jgi:hypothetical protein